MSKRFLRNQLPQILNQKCLTFFLKFDNIAYTSPSLYPIADGDDRATKARQLWQQYVATKQTNLSVFNSSADRDLMVTLRFLFSFNKKSG